MHSLGAATQIALNVALLGAFPTRHVSAGVIQLQHEVERALRGGRLTDSLVPGVQQLCERGGGSLGLDGLCRLFVLGQLTQDPSGHALDVLDGRVQELGDNKGHKSALSHLVGIKNLLAEVMSS